MKHSSISADLASAINFPADCDRAAALRKIARSMVDFLQKSADAAHLHEGPPGELEDQNLAIIYQALQVREMDELVLIDFARNRQIAHCICTLALLTKFPLTGVEVAFVGQRPEFLLILCRMQNFAWSTVRLLLDSRTVRLTPASVEVMFEEYHQLPIQQAQRFVRFLFVQFHHRAR